MQLDVSALISKVIERVVAQSAQLAPAQAGSGTVGDPSDLIAEALAGQVLKLLGIGGRDGAGGAAGAPGIDRGYEVLAARSDALARAVGACCCWGDEVDCPACGGMGGPGWRRPDRVAFDAFVAPMLRKMRQQRPR